MECLSTTRDEGEGIMYSNRDKFTVLQIFRTARVLERADYIAVHLQDDAWQVLKGKHEADHRETISTGEHKERMEHADQPIVLDKSYLETDDEGLVVFGW